MFLTKISHTKSLGILWLVSKKMCISGASTYTDCPWGVKQIDRLIPESLLRHEAWKVFVTIQFANCSLFSSFICISKWRHYWLGQNLFVDFCMQYMQKLFCHPTLPTQTSSLNFVFKYFLTVFWPWMVKCMLTRLKVNSTIFFFNVINFWWSLYYFYFYWICWS